MAVNRCLINNPFSFKGPFIKAEGCFVCFTTHDDRIDRIEKLLISVIGIRITFGCVSQPIEGSVFSRNESVQGYCNEYRAFDSHN